jgi:sporulation protein YlmC with PRC-barrel domain
MDPANTENTSGNLIAGERVTGTNVYDTAGEKLGEIEDVMIDKRSGKIAYAVMSFGGFLGIGDRYHPLPWQKLTYDTGLGGYRTDLDRRSLEGAPSFAEGEPVAWEDEAWGRRVHDYYGVPPYLP